MPERLPTCGADSGRRFFQGSAHRIEYWFDYSESQRKSDEYICQDDRISREHQLGTILREQKTAQGPLWSPKKQQSETRDRRRDCGGQRDSNDRGVASPEVITRQYVRGEETEGHIKNRGPETGHHRKLQRKYRFRGHQRCPEATETISGTHDEDGQQRQDYQRQHDSYITPMLIGRATSKPRTCRRGVSFIAVYFLFCTVSLNMPSIISG